MSLLPTDLSFTLIANYALQFIALLASTSAIISSFNRPLFKLLALSICTHLLLGNKSYYLSIPTYVCFYPVRGETYHHQSEKELVIQWKCYLVCAVLSAAAMGVRVEWTVLGKQLIRCIRLEEPYVSDEKEEEADGMLDPRLIGLDAGTKREDKEGQMSVAGMQRDAVPFHRNLDLRRYLFHALVIGAAGFSWYGFLVMVGHSRYSAWKGWD